jgi:hypothetical protein
VDDFADRPAEMMQARAAERLNLEHQLRRYVEWQRRSGVYGARWRRAAFSTDGLGHATADELERLSEMHRETVAAWRESIDREDGQEREPVYWFLRGFPVKP